MKQYTHYALAALIALPSLAIAAEETKKKDQPQRNYIKAALNGALFGAHLTAGLFAERVIRETKNLEKSDMDNLGLAAAISALTSIYGMYTSGKETLNSLKLNHDSKSATSAQPERSKGKNLALAAGAAVGICAEVLMYKRGAALLVEIILYITTR